ncbi:MAG: glycosyltransferase family 9 protein [Bacteroidales bacterium]|nr:glycosyltransferase family 9 protein [Bacteroidales bacterium]
MDDFVIKFLFAPGDLVVLTSVIKYFSDFKFNVKSFYPEILENNPNINNSVQSNSVIRITHDNIISYRDGISHYSQVLFNILNDNLNTDFLQHDIYPEIFLTEEEKDREKCLQKYDISGRFWIVNCGIKIDIPLKAYPVFYWEEIFKELNKRGIQLIQVGSDRHIHPKFTSIKNLVGKTENLRDFLSLCYHADGAISPVSFLMHVMAAFKKPCVVIGGGREDPRYEHYPIHQYLHTIGMIECCKLNGCWKKQRKDCTNLIGGNIQYPKCMLMIQPMEVVKSVLKYEQ